MTAIPVNYPQLSNSALVTLHPKDSLPILAIPAQDASNETSYTCMNQSVVIMKYLDEVCDGGLEEFLKSSYPMHGIDKLDRPRETELPSLAKELTINWNPVRTFDAGAGTTSISVASNGMHRWLYLPHSTIEGPCVSLS